MTETNLHVRLVRVNDMSVQLDENVAFEALLTLSERESLRAVLRGLSGRGIDLYKPDLRVRDVHGFIPFWIQNHHPNWMVRNTEHVGLQHPGYPDYELTHNLTGKKRFIEVKVNSDGLRKTQVAWFSKYQDHYDCYILYVQTPEEEK